MSNKKKKIIIGTVIIGLILLAIIGGTCYSLYNNKSSAVNEFNKFLVEYKNELETYSLFDNESRYDELIKECETVISNKDIADIETLKASLSEFKEKVIAANTEASNLLLAEVEAIDISNLESKDDILAKIEGIKAVIKNLNFNKANKDIETLKTDIHKEIEVAKELAIKKAEEEKKRNEEDLFNNIDGSYEFVELNKNGFYLRGYYLNIVSFEENMLSVAGGHTLTTAILINPPVSHEEATKDHEGYANHKSGSVGGELEYIGDYTWSGYIWDDRGTTVGMLRNSEEKVLSQIATIPIEIKIENTELIVSIDNDSIMRGTHTFTKEYDDTKYPINRDEVLKSIENEVRAKDYLAAVKTAIEEGGVTESFSQFDIKCYEQVSTTEELPFQEEYYVIYFKEPGSRLDYMNTYYVGKDSNTVYKSHYDPHKQYLHLMQNKNFVKEYTFKY